MTVAMGRGVRLAGRAARRARRLSPVGLAGAVALALLVAAATFGPFLWPHDPLEQRILARLGGVLATLAIRRDFLAVTSYECQDSASDGQSSQHRPT